MDSDSDFESDRAYVGYNPGAHSEKDVDILQSSPSPTPKNKSHSREEIKQYRKHKPQKLAQEIKKDANALKPNPPANTDSESDEDLGSDKEYDPIQLSRQVGEYVDGMPPTPPTPQDSSDDEYNPPKRSPRVKTKFSPRMKAKLSPRLKKHAKGMAPSTPSPVKNESDEGFESDRAYVGYNPEEPYQQHKKVIVHLPCRPHSPPELGSSEESNSPKLTPRVKENVNGLRINRALQSEMESDMEFKSDKEYEPGEPWRLCEEYVKSLPPSPHPLPPIPEEESDTKSESDKESEPEELSQQVNQSAGSMPPSPHPDSPIAGEEQGFEPRPDPLIMVSATFYLNFFYPESGPVNSFVRVDSKSFDMRLIHKASGHIGNMTMALDVFLLGNTSPSLSNVYYRINAMVTGVPMAVMTAQSSLSPIVRGSNGRLRCDIYGKTLDITGIEVSKLCERMGVGSRMVELMLSQAKEDGFAYAECFPYSFRGDGKLGDGRDRAKVFWEAMGFRKHGIDEEYCPHYRRKLN